MFQYRERGILDNTHLRFYTLRTIRQEIENAGFRVLAIRGSSVPLRLIAGRWTPEPIVFDRMLPDGRIFRNLAEVPRFHAVDRVSRMSFTELLARRDVDFAKEAVITDRKAAMPVVGTAVVRLQRYSDAEQRIATESARPFFLASSEKLTPELSVRIDGNTAKPVQINGLFAGVQVAAGKHTVMFSRRIGRGWWWPSALSAAALLVIAVLRR